MIKTIIVPTDGSDHAGKAIDLAADIAGKYGARVVVLHTLLHRTDQSRIRDLCKAYDAPKEVTDKLDELDDIMLQAATSSVATTYAPVPLPVPDGVLQTLGEIICEDAKKAISAKGAETVDVQIVDSSPADAIMGAAEFEQADMIIMGSRGLGKFADLLMGSVSHKVSHLSPCTCVTVK